MNVIVRNTKYIQRRTLKQAIADRWIITQRFRQGWTYRMTLKDAATSKVAASR